MPRGLGDIPDLRLEVLEKLVTKFMTPPNLILSNLFPSSDSPSSTVKWESMEGGRGMAPLKPPGAPTPTSYPLGVAQHSAEAAFWGDKRYYDEEFLNNLRKEGTESEYMEARTRLAREMADLVNRANRRREWLFANMITSGTTTYSTKGGVKVSVDYQIPTTHSVTLGTAYKWSNGTSRDILSDIIDGKKLISDDCGAMVDMAICNSTVLKYLAMDPTIQTILQKSAFGNGDLFGAGNRLLGVNPNVIAQLLDIPRLVIYDEKFEARAYLTAAVTGSSTTTVYVEDASDFVAGGTLRFVDTSAGTYEDETISSVDAEAGTVTISTAPTASFKSYEDYVVMRKSYIPDDKFIMMVTRVDGMPIAEYKRAPYGNSRSYGLKTDQWETKDPEGIYIRVQDKGLPVLYQRDALYILDVA